MGFGSEWWRLSKQLAHAAVGLLALAHVVVYVWPQEAIVSSVHPVVLGIWPPDVLVTSGAVRYVHFALVLGASTLMLAVGLPLRSFLLSKIENKLYPRMKLFNEAGLYIVITLVLQAGIPIQEDFERGFFAQREKIAWMSTRLHFIASALLYFVVVYHGCSCLALMHSSEVLPCRRQTAEGMFRRRIGLVGAEAVAGVVAAYFHPCNPFRATPVVMERKLVHMQEGGPEGWALVAHVDAGRVGVYASASAAAVAVFYVAFSLYIASFATDFDLIRQAVNEDRRRRTKQR
jgi:hypothetical protein